MVGGLEQKLQPTVKRVMRGRDSYPLYMSHICQECRNGHTQQHRPTVKRVKSSRTGTPCIALGRASSGHKVENPGTYEAPSNSETGERKAGPGPIEGHINHINPHSCTMVGTTTLTLTPSSLSPPPRSWALARLFFSQQ